MSFSTARVRAHIVGHVTALDISITEWKSPGLEIGKPASIMSTPKLSRRRATSIFSTVLSWQPGTCSPSRNVVSNTNNLSLITILIFFTNEQHENAGCVHFLSKPAMFHIAVLVQIYVFSVVSATSMHCFLENTAII